MSLESKARAIVQAIIAAAVSETLATIGVGIATLVIFGGVLVACLYAISPPQPKAPALPSVEVPLDGPPSGQPLIVEPLVPRCFPWFTDTGAPSPKRLVTIGTGLVLDPACLQRPVSLIIHTDHGNVTISYKTGEVTIDPGVNVNDAARVFWRAIGTNRP